MIKISQSWDHLIISWGSWWYMCAVFILKHPTPTPPHPRPNPTPWICFNFWTASFIKFSRFIYNTVLFNTILQKSGAVSIYRCRLTSIGIPFIKIRRPHDHLIFIMEIPLPGNAVLILKQGPRRRQGQDIDQALCSQKPSMARRPSRQSMDMCCQYFGEKWRVL